MNIRHFELVSIANEFLSENFDGIQLTHPIEFNSRIKRVLGRVIVVGKQPKKIELSVDLIKNHKKEVIIDIFKHELVHYALMLKGEPYSDGHPNFENKLRELGVSSTRSYPYYGSLHRYECKNCNKKIERKRKINEKIAYCPCSLGPNLVYVGEFNNTPDETSVANTSK